MTAIRRLAVSLASVPFYPVIIPIAFIIDVWQKTGVDPVLLIRPIVIAIFVAGVVTVVAAGIARNRHRGGVLAGIVAMGVIGGDDLRIAALAVVAILLLAVFVRREHRLPRPVPWPRVTSLLNLVTALTLGLLVVGVVGRLSHAIPTSAQFPTPVDPAPGAQPPDIVIVLLDGHGRQDLLADTYGEDISPFVTALKSRGFEVSGHSRSNYMSTQQTLASMFNFTQLPHLDLPGQRDPAFAAAAKAYIDHNAVFDILKRAGYRTATVTPGYDGVSIRTSDVFVDGGQVNELEAALITNTIVREALRVVAPDAFPSQIRDRVTWNLTPSNWLPALVAGRPDEPLFLYDHVPSPHPPFVFERDGTPTLNPDIEFIDQTPFSNRTPAEVDEVVRAYRDQVAYIDALTISALDVVLATIPSDSIVIVMSDHGPDAHVDWDHLTSTDARERFDNFFAARTPGAPSLFGDAPTPVNLFPTLLNHYLGTTLPVSSDSSFLGVPPRDELTDIGNPDADTK